jgi:hypothetical protein
LAPSPSSPRCPDDRTELPVAAVRRGPVVRVGPVRARGARPRRRRRGRVLRLQASRRRA